MKKRTIIALMCCSLILLLAGCGKGKAQTMTLALDSNPTTGYTWTVTQDPELFSVGASVEHNKLYDSNSAGNDKYYNNIQLSFLLNAFLFKHLDLDFVMTLQSLGEEGKRLSDKPFYRASVTYVINKYFSIGFAASSKWLLVWERNNVGGWDSHYKAVNSFAVGAFGGISF